MNSDSSRSNSSPSLRGDSLAHSQRFTFIDALRGLAALGVAVYHINRYGPLVEPADQLIPSPIRVIAEHGWMGVQVFFVISGFVIAYSLRNARITPRFLGNYVLRRAIRLDPPYWATICCVLLLNAVTFLVEDVPPPMDAFPTWPQFITHFFYLQNVLSYGNLSVGFWTLCIEVQFYILVILLLGLAQRLPWGSRRDPQGMPAVNLLIAFAPLALLSLFHFSMTDGYEDWIIRFFSMFFAGALAWWTLDGRVPHVIFWAFIAAMGFRLTLDWTTDIAVAAIAATAIYTVGRMGRLGTWLNASWLQYLGRISYSLYLIHFPVAHIVTHFGYRCTGDEPVPALLWTILAVVASLGAAHLLYLYVEAPSVRFAARFKLPAVPPLALSEG